MYPITIVFKAIDMFNLGYSYSKIARIMNITRQTITNWIKNYALNLSGLNNRITHNLKLIKNNIFEDHKINDFVLKIVKENPFITRFELSNKIYDQFKQRFGLSKISKLYKYLKLTIKKPKYHIVRTLEHLNEISIKRKEFIDQINKEPIEKIISIDESGFNNSNSPQKARSLKGTRVNLPTKTIKQKNVSLLMSVTTKGALKYTITEDNINTTIFFNFIKDIIAILKEKNYIFVFDNVPFHKNKEMLDFIESAGHKVIFTSPYSPNNNPIENIFSIIKRSYFTAIKNKNKNTKNIKESIIEGINNTQNKIRDFSKFFKRAFTYTYNVEEKELRDRIIFRDTNIAKIKANKLNEGIIKCVSNVVIDFDD